MPGSFRPFLLRGSAAVATLGLVLGGAMVSPASALAADTSAFDSVNPFIGTYKDSAQNKANDAYGNTWPGASVPFGMVQLSPTTAATSNTDGKNEYGNWGGYMWSPTDTFIKGFGMTRLSGTGCNDRYSGFDLPYLPYTGAINADGTLPTSPGTSGAVMQSYYNQFVHTDETAQPGYYSVKLDADGTVQAANDGAKNTTVQTTATTRTGVSTVTFPTTGNAALLWNVSGANNANGESQVNVDPATKTISGYATAKTVCNEGSYRIYFSTTFDQPFTAVSSWQDATTTARSATEASTVTSTVTSTDGNRSQGADKTGVVLQFAQGANVVVKTGISYVSTENAALNRTTETDNKSFSDIRAAAKATWQNSLGTLDVTGGTTAERTKLYTALYHSLLHPNVYEDVNGQYRGYYKDSKTRSDWPTSGETIKQLKPGQQHEYVTYSSWDSLRGQMQLVSLLFPKVGSDMAQSITNMAEQVGTWYNWPHLGSAQKKMEGDGMQSIVASLYAFGSTDFDSTSALNSMVNATTLGKDSYFRSNFVQYAGTGFIEDRWTPATSTTMDYSVADFGIAQLAQRLGDNTDYQRYMTRSQSWKSLISQDSAYPNKIVPRDRKGFWGSFTLSNRSNSSGAPDSGAQNRDQFDQSTGLQYQWYMTQNMSGVIDALGGKSAAETQLDSLFNYPTLDRLDVSGSSSNGAYLSNQPSMHTPWVYNWLGKPAKTTQVLDKAISTMYYSQAIDTSVSSPANPGFTNSVAVGLPGNDDLGSLSSWYVWANIGLYPAIYGRSELLVSSPNFDKIVITSKNLDGSAAASGRTLTINAAGQDNARYINGLSVNGTAQTKTWLPESFTRNGGTLDFTMTSATTSTWGTAAADAPPSFNEGSDSYNGVGTGEVGTKNAGSLDVGGVTLPRNALANATPGATPGAKLTYDDGVTYTWPDSAPLQPDHWVPRGQTIDMHGVKASKLSFLGTATNGPASGTAKVVYTDGTTVDVPVTFPDWTPSSWTNNATNQQRISATGRLKSDGTLDSTTWRVYSITPAALDSSKNIAKVILPNDVKTGIMHIFSIGTDAHSSDAPKVTLPAGTTAGGGTVTLSGSGVNNGDQVTVALATTPAASVQVTAGQDGTFTASLPIASVAPGSYAVTVTVTNPVSGQSYTVSPAGSVTVAYTPTITTAATADGGTSLAFTGSGFAPDESVAVTLGTSSTTVTANATGAIAGTITAPQTTGALTLTATGAVSATPANQTVTVTKVYTPEISSLTSVTAGTLLAFTGSGFAPDESVAVTLGTSSTTVTANATGAIAGTITAPQTTGALTLTATGAVSATPANQTVTVTSPSEPTKPKPTVGLSASRTSAIYGQPITLTAKVSSGATGTVNFTSDSVLLGTATISGGVARLTTAALPAGTHTLTATYAGSADYLAAVSGRITIAVKKVTTNKVAVSAKKYTRGKAAKVTVKVGKLSNGSYATGQVRVYVGKKKVKTARLAVGKKGKVTVTVPKKYTKKASMKVKASYVPSDTRNMVGKTSKTTTVQGKKASSKK